MIIPSLFQEFIVTIYYILLMQIGFRDDTTSMSIVSETIYHTGSQNTFDASNFFIRFATKTNVIGNTFKGVVKDIRFYYEVIFV